MYFEKLGNGKVGDKRIKELEKKMDELEKGLEELIKVRELDMGVGSMEEGSERSEGKENEGGNKLGNSDVKEEYNRIGGCSSYMGSVKSVEGISTTSRVFSDRESEVSMIKKE